MHIILSIFYQFCLWCFQIFLDIKKFQTIVRVNGLQREKRPTVDPSILNKMSLEINWRIESYSHMSGIVTLTMHKLRPSRWRSDALFQCLCNGI